MTILNGKYIVGHNASALHIPYQIIHNIFDYDGSPCILTKSLNPDFSIILNNVDIIITETGSALAHLAIIALEYQKTIIRLDAHVLDGIPSSGTLSVTSDHDYAKISIH